MRGPNVVLAVLAAASLAGCSLSQNLAPDTVSLADRCGEIMKAAMPFAQLDLGERTSRSPNVRTIVAQVIATRTDLPKDSPGEHDLAAECTFENNVMTAFRWTKGGPPPPPSADEGHPAGAAPPPATSPPAAGKRKSVH